MTYKEALQTMCNRCTNYEMCQGTGCTPQNMLAELVEKQIKKKPYAESWSDAYDNPIWEYYCPICGDKFDEEITFELNCCPNCGQCIDWE